MINEINASAFCIEDISKIENYEQAVADKTRTWCCHHKREIDENKSKSQLIAEKLYYHRPASELIFLPKSEHTRLHSKGKHLSEETKQKLSMLNSGEKNPRFGKRGYWFGKHGEKSHWFGKRHSNETLKKLSDKMIGMKYWNDGVKCVCSRECPPGFVRGRLKRK